MIFHDTSVPGVFIIDPELLEDERGCFARTFDVDEFARRGLCVSFVQCSISHNRHAGTLRGMHFQKPPFEEAKLVTCTAGAIYDVALDLRPNSPTFRQWCSVELTAENRRMVYIPEGVAHGFQTLADHSQVFYQISARFEPSSAVGVRWDDGAFGIAWPDPGTRIMSERDRSFPDFSA